VARASTSWRKGQSGNLAGRPAGSGALLKSIVDALGDDGRRKVGATVARALETGVLRFPGCKAVLTLSADQWIGLVRHFSPVPSAQAETEQGSEREAIYVLGSEGAERIG